MEEELFKLTGEKKGLKVLDIGTGTGFLALMMAELGNEVYGVDVSEGMMNIGKEHAKERNVDVKFVKNEGENLQFDDDFFDVVVNCRVLWTLVDPDVSFKEWKRVMKPGGKVISFIRDSKGMQKPKKEFIYSKELDEKLPLRKADEKTYMEYMERAGFKNSKVIRMRENLTVKRETDDNKKDVSVAGSLWRKIIYFNIRRSIKMRLNKKISKGIAIASLVTISGGFLAACGGTTGENKDTTASQGNQTTTTAASASAGDKTLRIGELWAIDNIDPVSDGTLIKEKACVTEVLCEVNDKFELQPSLATKWENKDENTWVFTLKEGVKFHDGTDMDAEAVAWSINNALEKNPTLVTSTKIAKAEATGANEVTITTETPNAELPEFMHLANMSIIGKGTYDSSGNLVKPIGTGPFKVEEFNSSTGVLTIVRNDDYHSTPASLAKVTISGMTDSNTRAMALEAGEIDFTCDLPFNELTRLDELDNVRVEKYDTARIYTCQFNCKGLFGDKKVRQATSLAMDRQTISDKGT